MADEPTGPPEAPDQHSEERLRLAVDAAGIGLWDWNIVTGEVVWSRQCRALYGLPPDATISYEVFLNAVHPEDRERVDAALKQAAAGPGIYNEEKRTVWPDGSVHWTQSRAQILCDETGRPVRMTGVTFDITERKQAEIALRAKESMLRLLFDHFPGMVAYTDAEHRYRYYNRAIIDFYAGSEAEVDGKTLEQVLQPSNGSYVRPLIEQVFMGETLHYQAHRHRRDGAERIIDVTLVPNINKHGSVEGVFAFIADITERIQAENDRVERARLAAANEELNTFASAAAHDLSAPLRAIIGFAEVLNKSDGKHLSEDGRNALGRIEISANQLQQLIAALLRYARSARGLLQVEQLDLGELTREALQTLQPQYPDAHVRVGPLPTMCGDRALIWDVLLNLIGNALKFSSRSPTPTVEIGTATTTRGEAVFVRDNGAGFTVNQAAQLFQIFRRLHDPSQFPGTGVGLAYARRVLMRHGSEIWAESTPGQGATFYFTVPSPTASSDET